MKAKKKHNNAPPRSPQPLALNVPGSNSTLRRLFLGLAVVVAAACTWAFFEFVVWNNLPPELVGKWVVLKGPDEGGTIDFYRSGAMIAKVNQGGYEGIINATVRVEENKIHVTTKHPRTGEVGTRIQTIKTLEGNRLVLQDERGNSIHLERAE